MKIQFRSDRKLAFWQRVIRAVCPCQREAIAEAVGTFILVFAGTGAIMVNQISQGAITHLGISFVFGAVAPILGAQLAVLIYRQLSDNFHDDAQNI